MKILTHLFEKFLTIEMTEKRKNDAVSVSLSFFLCVDVACCLFVCVSGVCVVTYIFLWGASSSCSSFFVCVGGDVKEVMLQ